MAFKSLVIIKAYKRESWYFVVVIFFMVAKGWVISGVRRKIFIINNRVLQAKVLVFCRTFNIKVVFNIGVLYYHYSFSPSQPSLKQ
ncbi:MAG: hypothetical protein BZ151_09700 [Desulfobacca sp. 4484_104]|nr:MAG: hypothetical protein BZ151_09700 [Desulfobacca sp. 4484_104]